MFESFYAQEWVQVFTAFAYVLVLALTPLIYWCMSQRLEGEVKKHFIKVSAEIYLAIFILLIAPILYLGLYFCGSESKFMLNDPMPWVCFLAGIACIIDLCRAWIELKSATIPPHCKQRGKLISNTKSLIKIAFSLSLIFLIYGLIMVVTTNLMPPESINSMLWFLTFMMTGLAIICTASSKTLLCVSQAYASNPKPGCRIVQQ